MASSSQAARGGVLRACWAPDLWAEGAGPGTLEDLQAGVQGPGGCGSADLEPNEDQLQGGSQGRAGSGVAGWVGENGGLKAGLGDPWGGLGAAWLVSEGSWADWVLGRRGQGGGVQKRLSLTGHSSAAPASQNQLAQVSLGTPRLGAPLTPVLLWLSISFPSSASILPPSYKPKTLPSACGQSGPCSSPQLNPSLPLPTSTSPPVAAEGKLPTIC